MLYVCAAVIKLNGKYLLCSRPDGKHLAGKWEFPGGKLDIGESVHDCIKREIYEELGVGIVPLDRIFTIKYKYPEKTVFLDFIRAVPEDLNNFNLHPHEGQEIIWKRAGELCDVNWVPADLPLAKYLSLEKS